MPPPEIGAALAEVIQRLAKRQDAPVFEPHLTLLGDLNGRLDLTHAAVQSAFAGVGPISARFETLCQSPQFFMSLYLATTVPDTLSQVRQSLSTTLRDKPAPTFEPHLSLAYGALPVDWSAADIAALKTTFRGRSFDLTRVAIVQSAKTIPIKDWTVETTLVL